MKEVILLEYIVKSGTYAMKGKQVLAAHGIRASVSKRIRSSGCEYYIKVPDRNLIEAEKILNKYAIIRSVKDHDLS